MISVYERVRDGHPECSDKIKSKKDLFKEFTHDFNGRHVHFDYHMYEDGVKWLLYNGLTIYTVTDKDFDTMIRFIGLTVYEFMVLIYHECAISPKFFVSEICRASSIDGTYTPYDIDIGKYTQLTAFEEGFNSILYNPRQTGSTMFLCAIYNWIKMFRKYSANILIPMKSKTDYNLFEEKVNSVREGLPHEFFNGAVSSTWHYQNSSQFINYLLINDFEFLTDAQYEYIETINRIKTKENIGVYPSSIGFSTKVQIVGNSTINRKPSELLEALIQSKYIYMDEKDFNNPTNALRETRVPSPIMRNQFDEILPKDYNKYILEIRFDEAHIMTGEELEHMKKLLPAEYYPYEIQRVRPHFDTNVVMKS